MSAHLYAYAHMPVFVRAFVWALVRTFVSAFVRLRAQARAQAGARCAALVPVAIACSFGLGFCGPGAYIQAANPPEAGASAPRASDELLQLYPSTARRLPDGRVAVRIEAWVYERESRPGLRSALARYLKIDRDALSEDARARYDARTQLFRFDSERGKTVFVFAEDGTRIALPPTGADGRSRIEAVLGDAALAQAALAVSPREAPWLAFRAVLGQPVGTAESPILGRALWVPERGISVVSDIDDTIKESNVLVRRELLLNTFVRPFVAVNGMAARYREFVQAHPDLRVHYVSGSPHQLYPALAEFIEHAEFPAGSVHLRDVRLRRELAGDSGGTQTHKLETIRRLIADFPQRRFVLIGDSGERDPEIYAAIAREHPQQVLAIWIRDVTGQPREHPRYAAAFSGLDSARWRIFDDPARIVLP